MPEIKNGRQEKFAQLVASGKSATEAYLEAGYKPKKKDDTTRGCASQVRSNTIVAARIAELQQIAAERAIITQIDALKALVRSANFDPRKMFTEDGALKAIQDIPDEVALCITGIDFETVYEGFGRDREQVGELKKFKFEQRSKYWEMIGRHLKMFTDKIEHSGHVSIAEQMSRAESRRNRE
jgi:phage terminase small subunit